MSKNENSKPSSKVTAQNITPILTRGAVKNQASGRQCGGSGSLAAADGSTSICSASCSGLLEERLLKTLGDVISEKLKEVENRILQRFESYVASTRAEMSKLTGEVEQLRGELAEIRNELDDVRRQHRLTDAIITGISYCPNENPQNLLSTISAKICHTLSPHATAFRPKASPERSKAGKSAPLVVKFSSVVEQREFMFKLKRFGTVTLNSISPDFLSDSRVNVYESLTPRNNKILRYALRLNREGRVHSAFTRHGITYVRVKRDETPVKVPTLDALKTTIAEAGIAEA